MARLLQSYDDTFHWVCDNENKIGRDIYGVILERFDAIPSIEKPQIMIVVSSPDGKKAILEQLTQWEKKPVEDFWFFA